MHQESYRLTVGLMVITWIMSSGCDNSASNTAPDTQSSAADAQSATSTDLSTTETQLNSTPSNSVLESPTPPEGLGIDPATWSQYEPKNRHWLLAPALRNRGTAFFKKELGFEEARPGYDLENHDRMTSIYTMAPRGAKTYPIFTDAAFDELVKHKDTLTRAEFHQTVFSELQVNRFPELENLKILRISSCVVPPSVIDSISALTQLEECDLFETELNDTALSSAQFPPSLRKLSLRNNEGVTDASIPFLSKLTQLEELLLNVTSITDAGMQELQTALPNCSFTELKKK